MNHSSVTTSSPGELFSLAQAQLASGKIADAAKSYADRVEIGGMEEEVWYSRVQYARCLKIMGEENKFVKEALAAYNQRPDRAEPLYDLARFYREKSMHEASVLFSEAGLELRAQSDTKFVEEFVYSVGIREEYSISANYAPDPIRKDRGQAVCNWLALNRRIPASSRNLARSNLFFYVEPAAKVMPSFQTFRIGFDPPDDYRSMNPSVALWGERIMLIQRAVNYILKEDGTYQSIDGAPFRTRNFLLTLTNDFHIESSIEILPPVGLPKPLYRDESAFGDLRLFVWRDELWCTACFRELTPEGWCEQVLARIDGTPSGPSHLTNWRVMRPGPPSRHEKNWMPQVDGDSLRFIYLCDPTRIVDAGGQTVGESIPAVAAGEFRGGSQSIQFDGGWLCLIHEVLWRNGRRFYLHRFVWLDQSRVLRRLSRSFFFQKKSCEFAAGLAWHPDHRRLLISYGIDDGESWLATVNCDEIKCMLEDVDQFSSDEKRTPT